MPWYLFLYHITLYLSTLLCVSLALFLWQKRHAPGAAASAVLLTCGGILALVSALKLSFPEISLFAPIRSLAFALIPPAWLIFALQYSRHKNWLNHWFYLAMALEPLAVIWIAAGGDGAVQEAVGATRNSLDWAHIVYSYGLILLGILLFVESLSGASHGYRSQLWMILGGAAIPISVHLLYVLGGARSSGIDPTPIAFSAMGVMLILGVRRFWLYDLVPIARSKVIDGMREGLVIVDRQDRIVDANQAASLFLNLPLQQIVGKPVLSVLSGWGNAPETNWQRWVDPYPDRVDEPQEICLDVAGVLRTYEVRVTPLKDEYGLLNGRLIRWNDITERRWSETALRRQLEELTVLHSIAIACAEATSKDELLSRTTRIIGENLYTDNFGILLLERESGLLYFHSSYHGVPNELKNAQIPVEKGITGQVVRTGEVIRSSDTRRSPAYLRLHTESRSELCVPVKAGENILGVLNAESREIGAFSEQDERLMTTIAGQLALALERLASEAAERRRAEQLQAITEVSRDVTSGLERQQVFDAIVRHAAQLSKSEGSGLFIHRPDNRFYLVAAYGVGEEFIRQLSTEGVTIEGSAVGRAFTSRNPVLIPDVHQEENYRPGDLAESERIRSILALPLLVGSRALGGLVLWRRQESCSFSNEEVMFVQALASQSANAIENVRLFDAERSQRQMAEVLREISLKLSTTLDEEVLLDSLLKHLERVVPFVVGNIMRVEGRYAQVTRVRGYERTAGDLPPEELMPRFLIEETPNLKQISTERRPLFIADIETDPGWQPKGISVYGRSWLGGPVMEGDRVIAFFSLFQSEPNFYQPEHAERLALFASQASLALQNARLFLEARRRANHQEAINAIIAAAVSAPDLHTLLEITLDEMIKALGAKFGTIWAPGVQVMRGQPENLFGGAIFFTPPAEEIGETQVIDCWGKSAEEIPFGIQASISVPVLREGRLVGWMGIASDQPRKWLAEEIALLEAVGRQLGSAIERHHLASKTREQAQQMQELIATVPEGVLLLNAQHRIELANPAAWEHLNVLAPSARAEGGLSHLGEIPLEALLVANGEPAWREITTEDPSKRIFEAAARPLGHWGKREGWVLVIREITEEREYQARLQMQDRLATVGQLAAGIAHDFNNIMAAIVVYADLLTLDPNLSDQSRERLGTIQEQVSRATSLIRQILDFSRRSIMEQSDLDLLPFLKEFIKMLSRVLPESIRVEFSYQPERYLVNADPTRLQQVFMNLALNARDAMPEGGVLRFELARLTLKPQDTLAYPDLTPGDWVLMRVKDTGMGIAAENLPRIFDPFFSTKPVGQGTGLGLAQVYGIIKGHQGSIDVQSTPGKGTLFTLYLPAAAVEAYSHTDSAFSLQVSGNGQTVLVVEDDAVARDAVRALLESQGFRVLTARNGKEALRIYGAAPHSVAVVVSDVVMPEMGGVELYHELNAHWPGLSFLFMTGHPLEEESQALLEAGRVNWLAKPFSVTQFIETLQGLLK